ncbi:SatD family protein [Adhaeribacter aquaticus]|uniref:SatD family protein n=1 Tax=Adhaeribacter aquaticus TaxID=299567 RepID=UPI00040425F1|nr:SatD family protein [Adhaeribacter aquaticus]
MADIQNSSKQKGKALMEDFAQVVQTINQAHANNLLSPLTITLGDEFQGIVKGLAEAISLIVALEEQIIQQHKTFKLRYVLHYGEIDTPINKEIAYGMLGSGLTYTRHHLEELKMKRGERFFTSTNAGKKDEILNKLFFLYSSIIDGWNQKDVATASLFIQLLDYKKVAVHLNKDRSLLWRKEKTLRMQEYFTTRELLFLAGAQDS